MRTSQRLAEAIELTQVAWSSPDPQRLSQLIEDRITRETTERKYAYDPARGVFMKLTISAEKWWISEIQRRLWCKDAATILHTKSYTEIQSLLGGLLSRRPRRDRACLWLRLKSMQKAIPAAAWETLLYELTDSQGPGYQTMEQAIAKQIDRLLSCKRLRPPGGGGALGPMTLDSWMANSVQAGFFFSVAGSWCSMDSGFSGGSDC